MSLYGDFSLSEAANGNGRGWYRWFVILMQLCLRLVGVDRGKKRNTGKGKKGKEKGGERQVQEHRRERETVAGGLSKVSNGGLNPFRGYCGHCWKWSKLNVINGTIPVSLLCLTLDPLYRRRAQAVNSSPDQPACWLLKRTDLKSGVMIGRATRQKTGMMTDHGPLQKNNRVNGTMMRIPIWRVESLARIHIRNRTMRK